MIRLTLFAAGAALFLLAWLFLIPVRELPVFETPGRVEPARTPGYSEHWVSNSETREAHSATLAMAGNTPVAVWYGGTEEGHRDVALFISSFDGHQWTRPDRIMDRAVAESGLGRYIRKVGNPALHVWPDGAVGVFFVTVSVGGWAASSINYIESTDYLHAGDQAPHWTKPVRLTTSPFLNLSTLVRNPAITHPDGSIGLPVYHEFIGKFAENLRLSRDLTVLDKRRISWGTDTLQPSISPISETHAVSLLRHAGASPTSVQVSSTTDGGLNWSEPVSTGLPNPNSAVAALNLGNGKLLMALNDTEDGRHRLSLALRPVDGSGPWQVFHTLEEADTDPESHEFEYSYPTFSRHGEDIHLVYTYNQARIKHVRFNLAWLNASLK